MFRAPAFPLLAALLLTACSATPPRPVNPITRLPPQTKPVPPPDKMPAFGSDEFNRIKDTSPDNPPDVSAVPDAEPVEEPRSKYGNKSPYTVLGATYKVLPSAKGFKQTGQASWYGKKFHGLRTSSGEKYDMYKMTAAHRNLPLPSYVRVTNLTNDKSVIVKVNDRGPFHSGRVMDLSYAAAARLDMLKTGTAKVSIEAIDPAEYHAQSRKAAAPPQESRSKESFFVQVGAFSEAANAAALQARILDLVQAPVAIASSNDPTPVKRVQIGPFSSREDAAKVSQIIESNDLGKPIVVAR